MAFFPMWLLRAFGRGALANPETGPQTSGGGGGDAEASHVTDERALAISAVYACARIISQTIGSLPLGFYERTKDGRQELDPDHTVVQLLKRKPNSTMTAVEFRQAMTLQRVLWGNAYALMGFSGTSNNRRVSSLIPLRPGFVTVHRMRTGDLQYHYSTERGINIYAATEIFHLKGMSTDGVIGLSPLAMARHTLGLSVAAERFSAGAFRNGGRPIGTLNFSQFLNPDQREQARKVYSGITAGAENNANAWVLEGGSKYEAVSIPPDDLQMLDSRKFQLAEICRFFGVPSHLVNDSEKASAWGSGLEQLNLSFLQYCLSPYLVEWETVAADSLLTAPDKRKVIVEHNVEGLLRADSEGRADYYSKMAQNGLMTRNEIRRKENLPPVAGGDELTVQVNLTPLDKLPKATGVSKNAA
jgi:HK97 family phage portal protein